MKSFWGQLQTAATATVSITATTPDISVVSVWSQRHSESILGKNCYIHRWDAVHFASWDLSTFTFMNGVSFPVVQQSFSPLIVSRRYDFPENFPEKSVGKNFL